jgi:hypothetical protein
MGSSPLRSSVPGEALGASVSALSMQNNSTVLMKSCSLISSWVVPLQTAALGRGGGGQWIIGISSHELKFPHGTRLISLLLAL